VNLHSAWSQPSHQGSLGKHPMPRTHTDAGNAHSTPCLASQGTVARSEIQCAGILQRLLPLLDQLHMPSNKNRLFSFMSQSLIPGALAFLKSQKVRPVGTKVETSKMEGWGAQLGNRFVSFVCAYAWSGCLVESLGGAFPFPVALGVVSLLHSRHLPNFLSNYS
jgi:hypothetical protein